MRATILEAIPGVFAGGTVDIEVSVIMPCLNEARTVGRCVNKARHAFEQLGIHGEVIVADNGSSDSSSQAALVHGARVVHVARRGYGSALQAGIAEAHGRYFIMGDADDSYDFTQIEPFVRRLRAGDDLVLGNRFQGGIQPGAMPCLHRYIGNPILSGLLNVFFHTPVHDAHCGLRAFRKDAYQRLGLRTTGMEFASEMVIRACLHGLRTSEVPVILYPDGRGRRPHLRSFRDGWRHLRLLLLLCPLWLYLIPSAMLLCIALALMLWPMPASSSFRGIPLDVTTMVLGTLCLLLSYQTLWLWAYARMFGWTSRLLPQQRFSFRVLDYINMERGLMAGVILFLVGFALTLWLFYDWYRHELGARDVPLTLRQGLWGLTMMILGVQTTYGSFFLGMLRMTSEEKS